MEARAVLRFVRIAPRKTRLVIDLIRGKNVQESVAILTHLPRSAAKVVKKLLHSAVANAEQKNMNVDELKVAAAYVNQGPTLKRFRARAMGRGNVIRKRTSHITLVLSEEVKK
ncbi:MAG: 50S ribosomal protein L22 [Nitrospirota bacterium]